MAHFLYVDIMTYSLLWILSASIDGQKHLKLIWLQNCCKMMKFPNFPRLDRDCDIFCPFLSRRTQSKIDFVRFKHRRKSDGLNQLELGKSGHVVYRLPHSSDPQTRTCQGQTLRLAPDWWFGNPAVEIHLANSTTVGNVLWRSRLQSVLHSTVGQKTLRPYSSFWSFQWFQLIGDIGNNPPSFTRRNHLSATWILSRYLENYCAYFSGFVVAWHSFKLEARTSAGIFCPPK